MVSWKDPLVYTNLLFFLNAVCYAAIGFRVLGILFLITAICSLQYHRFPKNAYWKRLDIFFASLSLLVVLGTIYVHLSLFNAVVLTVLALLTLIVKRYGDMQSDPEYYKRCHSIWHLCVFYTNILVVQLLF